MDNPFVYGEAVSGEYFTNREKEIKELKSELKNSIIEHLSSRRV